ncbi:MAG: sigma-70 family RNA polymerase sigma factor [Myxococcales bacterium]|nr:sigma-70 family RNA polymerase sigma factor [Myxococcales bacterium]
MRAAETESRDLLRRAAAGDDQALTRLYEDHVDGLYAFVFARVGRDPSLAEDVVQETFLRALGRTAAYDPTRGSLAVWLCWLARNAIRDGVRDHRRGDALAASWASVDATMAQLFQGLDPRPLSDELLARAETRELVSAAIANLPARYRDALTRKYVLEDSLSGIAGTLAITEEAAKSLLARARRAFRATFEALVASDPGAAPAATARVTREAADV